MLKSKLITLLKTFSKEEMKEFEKFISSPYFSSGRNLKPFYNAIKKYHPLFNSIHFTAEKIFKKLYPEKKYDMKKSPHLLRVIVSEMVIMAERFLMVERLLKNTAFRESSLLGELRNRKLKESFASSYKKISKSISSEKAGQSYFFRKFMAEQEREGFWIEAKKKDIQECLELQSKTEDSLILYFISELIRHVQSKKMNYHKEAVISAISGAFYENFNYDKFITKLLELPDIENDFLKILFFSAKLDIDFNDKQSYENLKYLLNKNYEKINIGFYYSAVSRLMNFTMYQKIKDVDFYKMDYIEFYESLIKKAVMEKDTAILRDFALNMRAIFNAARIYNRLNLTDRLEYLFKNYSKYIPDEVKKDALNLIQGSIEFARGNYESTLKTLSRNKITIPMVVKEIKIIKMKSLFELGYYDSLTAEIDAYRHYLQKALEIPESYKKTDIEFLRLLSRLARIKENKKYDELLTLKKEVVNLGFTTYHTAWILEKISELL